MLTIHELLGEVDRLPEADKWQLVKHVLDTLEQAQSTPTSTADYHQFLRETYGALRDTPIERWDQGEYEKRAARMKYLLDTDSCIRYLNGRSPAVFQRLHDVPETDICVCSVVKLELRYGALRSTSPEKTLAQQEKFLSRYESLPFDDAVHIHAAKIRADLANVGTPDWPLRFADRSHRAGE